jgi:hypothetical protein
LGLNSLNRGKGKSKRLKIIIMKTSKTSSGNSDFKLSEQKGEKEELVNKFVHPRIKAKTKNSFGAKNASNSLLLQMYSQENEILFI